MDDYYSKWCCLILIDPKPEHAELYLNIQKSLNCTIHIYASNEILQGNKIVINFELRSDPIQTNLKGFENAFSSGFRKVLLVKDKLEAINVESIKEAFNCLKIIEFCIGPGQGNQYYALGMNYFEPAVLKNHDLKSLIKEIGNLKMALYKMKTL